MSAATALVALVEALEEHKINAGDLIMMPAFGGGLTWSAHLLKWGDRTTPINTSDVVLPAADKTGLEMVMDIRARREVAYSA